MPARNRPPHPAPPAPSQRTPLRRQVTRPQTTRQQPSQNGPQNNAHTAHGQEGGRGHGPTRARIRPARKFGHLVQPSATGGAGSRRPSAQTPPRGFARQPFCSSITHIAPTNTVQQQGQWVNTCRGGLERWGGRCGRGLSLWGGSRDGITVREGHTVRSEAVNRDQLHEV